MLLVQNRREGIPHGTFLKGSILAQSQALHFFLGQANYIVLEDNKSSSPVLWFAFASLTMSLVLASQMSSCCLPRLLSVCRIDSTGVSWNKATTTTKNVFVFASPSTRA